MFRGGLRVNNRPPRLPRRRAAGQEPVPVVSRVRASWTPSPESPRMPDSAPTSTAAEPQASPRKSNRAALLIVFLVVFIDLLGFGIVLPLLPLYATELLKPLFPGDEQAARVWR